MGVRSMSCGARKSVSTARNAWGLKEAFMLEA